MSVGQFTKLWTLQRPVTVADDAGGQSVTSYARVRMVWGRLQSIGAREQAQAGAVQTVATHRVTTHYGTDIVTTQRLTPKGWTGATLEILGIRDPDGTERELELDCAEVI